MDSSYQNGHIDDEREEIAAALVLVIQHIEELIEKFRKHSSTWKRIRLIRYYFLSGALLPRCHF